MFDRYSATQQLIEILTQSQYIEEEEQVLAENKNINNDNDELLSARSQWICSAVDRVLTDLNMTSAEPYLDIFHALFKDWRKSQLAADHTAQHLLSFLENHRNTQQWISRMLTLPNISPLFLHCLIDIVKISPPEECLGINVLITQVIYTNCSLYLLASTNLHPISLRWQHFGDIQIFPLFDDPWNLYSAYHENIQSITKRPIYSSNCYPLQTALQLAWQDSSCRYCLILDGQSFSTRQWTTVSRLIERAWNSRRRYSLFVSNNTAAQQQQQHRQKCHHEIWWCCCKCCSKLEIGLGTSHPRFCSILSLKYLEMTIRTLSTFSTISWISTLFYPSYRLTITITITITTTTQMWLACWRSCASIRITCFCIFVNAQAWTMNSCWTCCWRTKPTFYCSSYDISNT